MYLHQLRRLMRLSFFPLLILVMLAGPALAQVSTGTIVGHVTDSSGAVVPGVTVKATNESTNVAIRAVSNGAGSYLIPQLNPGTYTVSATRAGFKTFVRPNIELRIGDRLSVDIVLTVGTLTQRVVVSARTPLLQTVSTNEGEVLSQSDVMSLPLPYNNARALIPTMPGVTLAGGVYGTAMKFTDPSRPGSTSWLSFSGSPTGSTEFLLDGVPNTQTANSDFGEAMSNQPPNDAIQEMKVVSVYDASVGHTSGELFAVVLKSGTNHLHGDLDFHYRNPNLNANSFFGNMAGRPRLMNAYERGTVNIGGPVVIPKLYNGKNRTFFSYTYDYMNDYEQGYPLTTTVPTMAERQGDFSALLNLGPQYQIYDPATIAAVGGGRFSRLPLQGNIIPPARINPIAANFVNYWPQPNTPGLADGANNYTIATPDPNRFQNHIFRFDQVISDKQHLYLHVAKYFKKEGPYRNYDFPGNVTGNFARIQPLNVGIDDNYIFTPRLVMDVRAGFQRYPIAETPSSTGFDFSTLGFSQAVVNQFAYRPAPSVMFPTTSVSGYKGLQGEGAFYGPDEVRSWFVDFFHPIGNHSLKFGADEQAYYKNYATYTNGTPYFSFGCSFTNGPLDNSPCSPDGIGQGLAALLLGQPTGGGVNVNTSYAVMSTEHGFYVQDNWRVTPKLMLAGGLRYEYNGPMSERYDRTTRGFDPTATLPITSQVEANYAANPIPEIPASQFQVKGGVLFPGADGQPHTLYPADTTAFMPRLGLAWHAFKNTVFRAGYGIFYLDNGIVSRDGPYQLGYSQTTPLVPTLNNGLSFYGTLDNPFPGGIVMPTGNSLGPMTNAGLGVSYFDTSLKRPYMQRWNFTIQQLLPGRVSLQLAYAASRSIHLRIGKNYDGLPDKYLSTLPVRDQTTINQLTAQVPSPFYPLLPQTSLSGDTVAVSQLLLPFPQFTSMTSTSSQGYSLYNSLEVLVERRFSQGFSFNFNYTLSKEMDATSFLNAGDPLPYYSISPNDRTNHFGVTGLYELPFGQGKRWLATGHSPLRKAAEGWEVGFVVNSWGGTPLSFGDVILTGQNIALPSGERTIHRWFNTNAFVTSPSAQLADHLFQGPLYYSGVRTPGLNTTDIDLMRNIRLREHLNLQLRWEMLNAFNHPNFGSPNTTVTSSAFGTISSENTYTRIMQIDAMLTF